MFDHKKRGVLGSQEAVKVAELETTNRRQNNAKIKIRNGQIQAESLRTPESGGKPARRPTKKFCERQLSVQLDRQMRIKFLIVFLQSIKTMF